MSNVIYTPFLSYLRIAAEAHEKMLRYINSTGQTSLDSDEFPQTAGGQATIVVVYCCISLECYIFNYATRRLGETFCKKHVDRHMSLHAKWLIVPKLATGKAIPADHNGIALLQKLVKARNSVVHAKAVNLQPDIWEKQTAKITETGKTTLDAALNAFRCVGELGSALSGIDPEEPGAKILAGFLGTPKYSLCRDSCAEKGPTIATPLSNSMS